MDKKMLIDELISRVCTSAEEQEKVNCMHERQMLFIATKKAARIAAKNRLPGKLLPETIGQNIRHDLAKKLQELLGHIPLARVQAALRRPALPSGIRHNSLSHTRFNIDAKGLAFLLQHPPLTNTTKEEIEEFISKSSTHPLLRHLTTHKPPPLATQNKKPTISAPTKNKPPSARRKLAAIAIK